MQQDYYKTPDGKSLMENRARSAGFDVVYVDVGGLSGSDGLLEAISLLSSLKFSLEPRCIVIKSLCVQRLSNILVPYWRVSKES